MESPAGPWPLPFLRAIATPSTTTLDAALRHHPLGESEARWVAQQGLAPYTFYLLRRHGLLDRLAPEVAANFQRSYYSGALIEAVQHEEAFERIFGALNSVPLPFVVQKGIALAHTVYPSPRCRLKGDLDLWIQPESHAEAVTILEGLGYHLRDKEDRPAAFVARYDGELQMVGSDVGAGLIELQWPAIRGQWIRRVARVDNDAIWRRRQQIQIEGHPIAVLSPEDTLLHLIVHLGINHSFSFPWLRALLDIHLLLTRLQPDLQVVAGRAVAWRLATVSWVVLRLCRQIFRSPLPEAWLDQLAPGAARVRLIDRLRLDEALLERWEGDYMHGRFVSQLALIDRPQEIPRLLARALFPEREWLEARYGVEGSALWRERLLHPLRLLVRARA